MILLLILAGLVLATILAAYFTNPFNKLSPARNPFSVSQEAPYRLTRRHRLRPRQQLPWLAFAVLKNGVHIVLNRYLGGPKARRGSVEQVVADVYRHRFRENRPLLITGDHFNSLFVRNLGVFYYPVLDPAVPGSARDWADRQRIYLRTTAYALEAFSHQSEPATTIVPTGRHHVTAVNFFAYPSDTVYGIFFALAALTGKVDWGAYYAGPGHSCSRVRKAQRESAKHAKQTRRLDTVAAGQQLTEDYRQTLQKLYAHYRRTVWDETRELTKGSVALSGAKDITPRRCAFYDNVIFWKTTSLASQLGIHEPTGESIEHWRRRVKETIIEHFWDETAGYFLEQLSPEAKRQRHYASDWLIVLATGFLDLTKPRDRRLARRIVDYIIRTKLDEPLPLRYHADPRRNEQVWAVRFGVASYGNRAIWSFWGMEYIKMLLQLGRLESDPALIVRAERHLASYRAVMERERGFPEVLDERGRLLKTGLYAGVRQSSWVIGFDQARGLAEAM